MMRRAMEKGACSRPAAFGGSARLALVSLLAVLGSLAACGPKGHVEAPAQPRASGEPDLAMALAGAQPAGYRSRDDGNRLGDTPARADDYSRLAAQLASETTGTPHINDVARRIRYNSAYFEIDVEVNRERGIVPVTWDMLRAHTPLVSQAYYALVYTSRGWVDGRQVPGFGPDVILPEAFTPELTPVIFDYFRRAFVSWNLDFNGWTQAMAEAWLKSAAIHVARVWTPQYVGGVAVASARASQITGQMALGAAAVPNAAAAARACAGGRCPPAASSGAPKLIGPAGAARGGGWLRFHEGPGRGHTLARHVGQTDTQLTARLASSRRIRAASSFTDQATAESVIGGTIRANRSQVQAWLRSASAGDRLRINYSGTEVIGRGIRRGDAAVGNRTNARVILQAEGRGRYHVLTAFPE